MSENYFFDFIENVVFWIFVYLIVVMGCETPAIVFTGFGFFLLYWILRFMFKQEGAAFVAWLHLFNMLVSMILLYYFVTGSSIQKVFRSALNSAAKRYPTLEPYTRRC